MRRYILFVLFLCLHWVAWGQKDYEYRYWFDKDHGKQQTGTFSSGMLHIDADLSGLDASLHAFHLQVKDTGGVWSAPVTRYFVHDVAPKTTFEYWMDSEMQRHQLSAPRGHVDMDVSGLEEGLHFLRFQLSDNHGQSWSPLTRCFFKIPREEDFTCSYWVDADYANAKSVKYTVEPVMLDVADMEDGFHILYMQVHSKNSASMPATRMFIKVPQTAGVSSLTCICLIDGQLYKSEQVASEGGVVKWDLDVASLSQGLHNMQVQVLTPTGAATNVSNHFFIRTALQEELDNMSLVYSVDGKVFQSVAGKASNGLYHFDVDVASLDDGLHRITYQLASETGTSTRIQTDFFVRTPVGGYGIMSYRYWLNNNMANAKTVQLDKRTSPFVLTKLLPVDTEPIRSACFQFEVKDGRPMVYAKNDFHISFFDATGRQVDECKQYVDYGVSQVVEDITDLQATQTFARPAANTVKWFKFEAEKGDSVSFASSLATSIQLFDSVGVTIYGAEGAESVTVGGTHILANGTYYLAVHDVTGTKSNNLTLKFNHIDKFDLFGTSQAQLGVMPCVQILELDGNGLDNLKSAMLCMGDSTIHVDSIGCKSKSEARLYMKLHGKEQYGKYHLVLNFDDGETSRTLTKENYVTLSAPKFNEIAIEITDPRSVADPYPVKITLTNKSNIAYQAVPFFFALDHIDKISRVDYMDFAVGCSKELYESGMKLSFEYDDFRGNKSKTRVVPTIIPEILPGESMTFTLGIKTGNHQIFNTYAWVGTPWNLLGPEATEFITNYTPGETRAPTPAIGNVFNGCTDDPCDFASAVGALEECTCAMALALGGTLGGIQNALHNMCNRAEREKLIQSGLFGNPYDFFPDRYLPCPGDLFWYWLQHCLPERMSHAASVYNKEREMIDNNPNCPEPTQHSCNAYNPGDPNEMHGYVSVAGSKYMRADVSDVYYAIEFENDPEIANASAHKIVVRDTLDAQKFDLQTFKPTKVQIGEQILELDGAQNFTKTIDMRPSINAIAQVNLAYSATTGIATWTITSLDPMTMEETYDIMQGVLPVNSNGNGIGFLNYDISLKQTLTDGDSLCNRASIIFDYEDPIMTPTWTNTVDAIAPESQVTEVVQLNDSIARIYVEGADSRSGVWKYDVYVQQGSGAAWIKAAECTADSSFVDYRFYEGLDYGFCVHATDSAGNVEQKELAREGTFVKVNMGDVNSDGEINTLDTSLTNAYYLEQPVSILVLAADVNGDGVIDTLDSTQITQLYLNANNTAGAKATMARQRITTTRTIKQ